MVETLSKRQRLLLFCGRKWAMARAIEKSQTVIQAKETTFVEQLLTVVKSTEATWLAQWLLLEKRSLKFF